MNTLYKALPLSGRLSRAVTRAALEALGLKERFTAISPQELIERGDGVITIPYDMCFSREGDRIRDRGYPYVRNGIRFAKPDEYDLAHNTLLRKGEKYRVEEDQAGWTRLVNLDPRVQEALRRLESLPVASIKDNSDCVQVWRELPRCALPHDGEVPLKGVYPSTLGMAVPHVRQEPLLYNTLLGEVWWHAPEGAEVGDACIPYLYSIEFKY